MGNPSEISSIDSSELRLGRRQIEEHRFSSPLRFQVIRRTIATLAQKKGTVKDVQGLMRHSRTATTTDVYIQEIPESVQATVNSINRELRKSSGKNRRKTVKPLPDAVAFGGKVLKRGAVSVKVFGHLTPNDTKRERRKLASC